MFEYISALEAKIELELLVIFGPAVQSCGEKSGRGTGTPNKSPTNFNALFLEMINPGPNSDAAGLDLVVVPQPRGS
jgi:hypothetical protein